MFTIYKILHRFTVTRYIIYILSFFLRQYKVKSVNKKLLKNIEGIKDMNIDPTWFTKDKSLGISGVARLKNGGYFLEKVIESHIPFLDEIILVDNMSTDSTKEICRKLQKKYPEKIIFLEYNYNVYGVGFGEMAPGNSIHSLAYYYNWCFSQSSYKYVVKVDDDNLLLPNAWKKIREYVITNEPRRFINFCGINLLRGKKGKIGVSSIDSFSGGYGDIGVYPVSPKTYYVQEKNFEIFKNNLYFKNYGISYLHLKFLKPDFGLINYKNTSFEKNIKSILENSNILDIQDFIKNKPELESILYSLK